MFYLTGIGNFSLFCCCDLDLDQMTFIYELDPYPMKLSQQAKNELSTSRIVKIIVLHTHTQTHAHIYRHRCHQKHYHAATQVIMNST